MMARYMSTVLGLLCAASTYTAAQDVNTLVYDVAVYGATPGGVAAAISASRGGTKVVLIDTHAHVGGMMAGGIGFDDVDNELISQAGLSNASAVAPQVYGHSLYYEKTQGVFTHYANISSKAAEMCDSGTKHEPHVAEQVLMTMLQHANVSIRLLHTVKNVTVSVNLNGGLVSLQPSRRVTSGLFQQQNNSSMVRINASIWIDASYEGDLAYLSGAPMRLGRESRAEYGEINAGVVLQDFTAHRFNRGSTGKSSPRVPAMTWRLCFSNKPSNRIPITEPPGGYNASNYAGYVQDVNGKRMESVWEAWSGCRQLPPDGTKCDINCNPRPLGFIWAGDTKEQYINSAPDSSERQAALESLRNLTLGLLYFQQNDPSVPVSTRKLALEYGLCADEFTDNEYFPWQLYIREGRRLVGVTNFTEGDMVPSLPDGRPPLQPTSIAIGSYAIDAFPASETRPASNQETGNTALEGYIGMETELVAPSTLPAQFMVSAEFPNLIVPVAVSASHVAFSSVRLEPTWMLIGQAAGILAALTLNSSARGNHAATSIGVYDRSTVDVLKVPLLELQQRVVASGVPLVFYKDLPESLSSYPAFQVLGPHGVAYSGTFSSNHNQTLERARAAAWLAGVRRARNSTVGYMQPQTDKTSTSATQRWRDYGPADPFFYDVLALATEGVVTPSPDPTVDFHPYRPISQDYTDWIKLACPDTTNSPSHQQSDITALSDGYITVAQGVEAVAKACLPPL